MSYRIILERDETGAWLARVPSVPGCHTYGRTLEQARRRIREALELWVGDVPSSELRFDIRLPAGIRQELRGVRAARERSALAQREASDAVSRAARDLTGRLGLSLRDAAELLGISHQRVQQLVSG
jgi:predicted RNase H-like HicB family nuclease